MRTDRVTHSALGGAGPENMAIYGFTNQDITTLVPLARFWNYPPEAKIASGAKSVDFDQAQKAYVLEATGEKISLAIEASGESPLVNPCFVIRNWGENPVSLSLNGKAVEAGSDFRYGTVPVEGGYNLVVWLRTQLEQDCTLTLE
jgi:hypothetical protein